MQIPMSPAEGANGVVTNVPEANIYVYPCYWGGVTRASVPPMIHGKLGELRREIGGIAAKKAQGGPQFPVRSAKELAQKLAQALQDLNMVAMPVHQDVTLIDTDKVPDNKTASGKPVFRTLAHVKTTVRVGAEDGSFVDMVGSGHGGDVDDKAGGKADTYGWKSALLKGLSIPEQDMLDTDDEEPSQVDAKPAKVLSIVKDKPSPAVEGTSKEVLAEVTKLVEGATNEQLDELATKIKAGEYGLSAPDKLKLSAAFVKRRKELDTAKNESK